jgi:hypothetical protein
MEVRTRCARNDVGCCLWEVGQALYLVGADLKFIQYTKETWLVACPSFDKMLRCQNKLLR